MTAVSNLEAGAGSRQVLGAGPASRKEIAAWAMYDFANSGYTTVVVTAIFNAYFVAVVAAGADWATFAWTAALSVSNILVMLIGPWVGAFADLRAAKKRLLGITTLGCVAATLALAWVGPGDVLYAMVALALASLFFGLGENLVAAFLPELADAESLGKVSGWGWSLGYLGGLLALALCLGYIGWAQGRGEGAADYVPVCMLITAGLFAVASAPTFLWLRERAQVQATGNWRDIARSAFARLARSWRESGEFRDLRRFLLCIVFYQAGVQTVVALAAIYAQQAMGFSTQDSVLLIMVVNVTAALGAFAFGLAQDRIGHVRCLMVILLAWLVTIVLAWLATDRPLFWLAANLAGLCLGAAQSSGRALVAYFSPPQREAEFFGLWGVAVRMASVLGPLTYGAITWIAGDHRRAMLATGVFFIGGLYLLFGIDAQRGRAAALRETARMTQ